MPADSGMAFVVVLHLSQTHESNLPSVLQQVTEMPVTQVRDAVKIEPNHVYVIPPAQQLEMVDGMVRVVKPQRVRGQRVAIDRFLRTLAESFRESAVGIILSGAGEDGTLGIKKIKEVNGFTIAQKPDEAEYEQMPRSAISTGLVDWVLTIEQMPGKLLSLRQSTVELNLTKGDDRLAPELKDANAFRDILAILRVRTGHDFSHYKQPTLLRRIARHLQIHELEDLSNYVKFLRENSEEADFLVKNLLINVTTFFRDKEAFEVLEAEIIPRLFAGKSAEDVVRVWVAGCASGEEAYSIGMLLSEYASRFEDVPKIQIFASDVDDEAIAQARVGVYSESIVDEVSAQRLRRFFLKEGKNYRIKKELREMILFAPHNILRDPPFSKLDLITCRNVMIYLNRETQERLIHFFHFALRPNGILFVGASESAENAPLLFTPYNKKQRIYLRRPTNPIVNSTLTMPVHNTEQYKKQQVSPRAGEQSFSFSELHFTMLEKFAPPSVLVNEDYEIVHLSQNAGRFLQFVGGEPTNNLLKVVNADLRADLRAGLFTAKQERKTTEILHIRTRIDGENCFVNVKVHPVEAPEGGFMLVIFDEVAMSESDIATETMRQVNGGSGALDLLTHYLEEELQRTKERLRVTVEQYDTSIEELKAANEELQAINEELRSATEELETSKEELQSVNEELTTVNNELKEKIDEVSHVNSDLQNLMRSTDIGVLFLDRNMRIKRFTQSAEEIFNVIQSDIGRPFEHLTHHLEYTGLIDDARKVLRNLQPIELEIRSDKEEYYLSRILPYRTVDEKIDGVVLTFTDITKRKRAEEAVRLSEEKFRTLFESIDEGFLIHEMIRDEFDQATDFRLLEVNPAFTRQTGLGNETVGKLASEFLPNLEKFWIETYDRVARTGTPERVENYNQATDRWYSVHISRVGGQDRCVAAVFEDITERKRREAYQALLVEISDDLSRLTAPDEIMQAVGERLGAALNLTNCLFADVDEKRGEIIVHNAWNSEDVPSLKQTFKIAGYFAPAEHAGETVIVRDTATDPHTDADYYERLKIRAFVTIPFYRNGCWTANFGVSDSKPRDWRADEIEFFREVSDRVFPRIERARAEAALRESEERARALIKNLPGGAVFVVDRDLRYLVAEGEALTTAGFASEDLIGKTIHEALPPALTAEYETYFRRALAGETYDYEHAAHGRAFISRGIPLKNAAGEIYAVLAISYDITDRKLAEEALRDSEERIRIALEAAELGAWDWNIVEDRVAWNEQHFYLLGLKPRSGKIAAADFLKHIHPDDLGRVEEELRKAIDETGVYEAEFRILRADTGECRWMRGYGRVMEREGGGRASRMTGAMYDITQSRTAEETIRQSAERLRLIMDSAEDYAILTLDTEGIITAWNTGAEKIFGFSAREAVGQPADIIFTPEDRAAGVPQKEIQTALVEGRASDERWHVRKDDSRFYVSGVLVPLLDNGKLQGFAKIARDLTERRRMEEALRQADRRKDEFLATLAHELRNPLAPIRSGLEIIRRKTHDKESRMEALGIIERQTNQMVRLVDDLLDISRITQGKIKLQIKRMNLKRAIEMALEGSRDILDKADHELIISIPEADICIDGDLTRITQVIQNVLNNAGKYTLPGGKIWLTVKKEKGEAVVTVRDNGIGIPPAMLTKIFDLFSQIETASEQSRSGLGIGLSVVKSLVEMHHGTIKALSEGEGKGSEFIIRLPLAEDDGQPIAPEETKTIIKPPQNNDLIPEIDADKSTATKQRRILVVDDNADAVQMLEILLSMEGHEVRTAFDAESGIKTAKKFKPDVCLLDIGLPEMNGYEAAKNLRLFLPDALLISISGWGQEEDRLQSREAGFDYHLVKPVEIEDINKLLQEQDRKA